MTLSDYSSRQPFRWFLKARWGPLSIIRVNKEKRRLPEDRKVFQGKLLRGEKCPVPHK